MGGRISYAEGINRKGQIVGLSEFSSGPLLNHAFLWERGRMVDLNDVTTNLPDDVILRSAAAINDEGRITGTTCLSPPPFCEIFPADTHGFVLIPNAP